MKVSYSSWGPGPFKDKACVSSPPPLLLRNQPSTLLPCTLSSQGWHCRSQPSKTHSSMFMDAKLVCYQITAGAQAWASSDMKTWVKWILCWICAVGRTANSSCSLTLTQTGCVWFDTKSTAQSYPFTSQWRVGSVLHPNLFLSLAANSKEVCINLSERTVLSSTQRQNSVLGLFAQSWLIPIFWTENVCHPVQNSSQLCSEETAFR